MSDKKKIYNIILKAAIAAGFILVFWFIWYYHYREDKAGQIVLKSRYTFSVRIDSNGNVVNGEDDSDSVDHTLADAFGNLKIDEIGDVWIREFTAQYTQKYLAWSKQLKKITLNKTQILNESENTVLISFSAGMNEHDSENFASWNGVLDDGRISCEWVVSFYIDNHYDGTATIYVKSIDTPEDYGIAQYNQNKKNNVDKVDETQKKSLTKTAFVYGGKVSGNNKVPVTLVYTNDMGANWITCEIDKIYTSTYYYVEFFDENSGVMAVGYDKNEQQQSSRIYSTTDGGETWNTVGAGPATNIIKGIKYIDEKIGFFCYDYVDGMDSNLYMTSDSGKTFSKIILEPQELDSTALDAVSSGQSSSADNKLKWSDVYKEALVPVYGSDGTITVYLTQGAGGVYNNGKTAAMYQSTDKGTTFNHYRKKFIKIPEIA